jgi:hypothetical protein
MRQTVVLMALMLRRKLRAYPTDGPCQHHPEYSYPPGLKVSQLLSWLVWSYVRLNHFHVMLHNHAPFLWSSHTRKMSVPFSFRNTQSAVRKSYRTGSQSVSFTYVWFADWSHRHSERQDTEDDSSVPQLRHRNFLFSHVKCGKARGKETTWKTKA